MKSPSPGWCTQDTPAGVHVFPIEDTMVHIFSKNCPCLPKRHEQGYSHLGVYKIGVRFIYAHQAMDGRE